MIDLRKMPDNCVSDLELVDYLFLGPLLVVMKMTLVILTFWQSLSLQHQQLCPVDFLDL